MACKILWNYPVNQNNKLTRQNVCLYLIKLAQQKNANLILTRKCFTIAIKTIQLSSHIIKHDEFIKATFSSEQFFETNNTFALRGENLFLFHCVREDKKLNRVKLPCTSGSNPFLKNIFLELQENALLLA